MNHDISGVGWFHTFFTEQKNLPSKIVVPKFSAAVVEKFWKSRKVKLWTMNYAIFIVYTKTHFLEDPLTSNNAKYHDSLNEETLANWNFPEFLSTF